MRFSILIGMLLLFASSCSTSKDSAVMITDSDEETLRTFKTALWPQAYAKQDTLLLDQLLHEQFELIDDNGDKFSKLDELEYIANYGPSYDEFNFEITRLDIFDNGTAVITGTGTMKGVSGAEAYITKYQSTNVLIKKDGKWQTISSHVSGVKEETFPIAPND